MLLPCYCHVIAMLLPSNTTWNLQSNFNIWPSFWVILGTSWGHFYLLDLKTDFLTPQERFLSDFEPQLSPKLGPSWRQVGCKIDLKCKSKLRPISTFVFARILDALGVDFGGVLASKIDLNSVLKRKCPKLQKPLKNHWFFNVFQGSGGSNIDQKSIKNRWTNDFKIASQLKTEKTAKKLPTWPQPGSQTLPESFETTSGRSSKQIKKTCQMCPN